MYEDGKSLQEAVEDLIEGISDRIEAFDRYANQLVETRQGIERSLVTEQISAYRRFLSGYVAWSLETCGYFENRTAWFKVTSVRLSSKESQHETASAGPEDV